MIAKRMNLPPNYTSSIQLGKKRPGIGGVKKGTIPWNKNKKGYTLSITQDGIKRKCVAAKKNNKITDKEAENIRKMFKNKSFLVDVNKINKRSKNGKALTYERLFCKEVCKKYNVTEQYIFRIIRNLSKNV